MKSVIILPHLLPTDFIHHPVGEFVSFISNRKEDFFEVFAKDEISPETIVEKIDFPKIREKDQTAIGDTLDIFRDQSGKYTMTFVETKTGEYNEIASLLHSQGHKIYGKAMIMHSDKTEVEIDDILKIIYSRAIHKGFHFCNGNKNEVLIDNRWNILSKEISLLQKEKKRVDEVFIRIDIDNNEFYVFELLEPQSIVLIDIYSWTTD